MCDKIDCTKTLTNTLYGSLTNLVYHLAEILLIKPTIIRHIVLVIYKG